MRIFLFCLFFTTLCAQGQVIGPAPKITYDLPERLGEQIGGDEYKMIVDTAVAIVEQRYRIDYVKNGAIQLLDGQDLKTLNLDNIILKCVAEQNRSVWPAIIHEHFDNLFAMVEAQKKIDPKKYESVKDFLGLRIYPKETVEQRGGIDAYIARIDLEGTYTMLMLDLPGGFAPVQKKAFFLWRQDSATVFQQAINNIEKQTVQKVTKSFTMDNGVGLEMTFMAEENYAASYALDLEHNSPELIGEWGCAMAFPNKAMVTSCKISKDKPVDFVKYIQLSQPVIEKAYQDHPQPISDQFFWYYKGRFTLIPVNVDANGKVNVFAPAGLAELMSVPKK